MLALSDMCRDPILVNRGLLFRTTRDADSGEETRLKGFGLGAHRSPHPALNIEGGVQGALFSHSPVELPEARSHLYAGAFACSFGCIRQLARCPRSRF